jgi:hypothetical protein
MDFEDLNFEAGKQLAIPKLRLRMSRVMPLDPFWEQAFAPAAPPARKDRASTFAFHAGAETVLAFPRAFGRLISAFHIRKNMGPVG